MAKTVCLYSDYQKSKPFVVVVGASCKSAGIKSYIRNEYVHFQIKQQMKWLSISNENKSNEIDIKIGEEWERCKSVMEGEEHYSILLWLPTNFMLERKMFMFIRLPFHIYGGNCAGTFISGPNGQYMVAQLGDHNCNIYSRLNGH